MRKTYDIFHKVVSNYFHKFFKITKFYFLNFNSKYKIQYNNNKYVHFI